MMTLNEQNEQRSARTTFRKSTHVRSYVHKKSFLFLFEMLNVLAAAKKSEIRSLSNSMQTLSSVVSHTFNVHETTLRLVIQIVNVTLLFEFYVR